MTKKINAPNVPERGACDPQIIEEPLEIPDESPVPVELPVEVPVEAPMFV
jgi:hypothetical protein